MLDRPTQTAADVVFRALGQKMARAAINDLWGAGWTISPRRNGDPFAVDKKDVPAGMAYEWRNPQVDNSTWRAVPATRHEGVFTPVGYDDLIVVGGLLLMERTKEMQDAAHQGRIAKAHQNIENWKQKFGALSGGVRVWTGDPDQPSTEFEPMGDDPTLARAIIAQSPIVPPAPMPIRVAKYPWLQWLFDLISVEKIP